MIKTAYNRAPETKTDSGHLIGEFVGDERGATVIVVGSLHGNEPAGAGALRKVAEKLPPLCEKLLGRVYLFAGNVRALQQGKRFIDTDLNRHWTPENLSKCGSELRLKKSEDFEMDELSRAFDEILNTAQDEIFALDLHSTSAGGAPFALVGDTLRNRRFAQKFPVRILLGIEEQLDGTLLEYLNNSGVVTLGFEGGQHTADSTIENHEALIWLALVNSGILPETAVPEIVIQRKKLEKATGEAEIIEIRYREPVNPEDEFKMLPGFVNFDPVTGGQILAHKRGSGVQAPESGLILMPLYQKQGEDGFFIGRRVAPFWLRVSEILRNLRIADWINILPGVKKHPADDLSLVIDTKIARFFPLQIFHLLGFRKLRWRGQRLVVSRRRHDTKSPFVKGRR